MPICRGGDKYGTGCYKKVKSKKSHNMRNWQLCYDCAMEIHPEYYQGKKVHGVGGKMLKQFMYAPFGQRGEQVRIITS